MKFKTYSQFHRVRDGQVIKIKTMVVRGGAMGVPKDLLITFVIRDTPLKRQ
jgi:hypothetical protein